MAKKKEKKVRTRSRRARMRRKRQFQAIFVIVVVVLLAVFVGSYATLKRYVDKSTNEVISENIYIGNTEVSGMTKKEAKAALENQLQTDSSVTITMNVKNGHAEAFLKEIGFGDPKLDEQIDKAMNYGKKGSMWKRYRDLRLLETEAYVVKQEYAIDQDMLNTVLTEKIANILQAAGNAYITRNHATGESSIVKEEDGEIIDLKQSVKSISDYLNRDWNHKEFTVDLKTTADKPAVTEEMLKDMPDELGSFYTDAGGGERWTNLKTGASKLNGRILQPGEVFKMYESVAPFTEENGYAQGTAYENGQVVPSWGGGICQVSTTLYNAAIYAELEIIERHPHSMAVDYVEPSRDAAIAGGSLDFQFKNNYDTPIYILSEIDESNQLRVVIYGKDTRPKTRRVEFESETLSTEDYTTEYRTNPKLPYGDIEYSGSPHTGRDARLWKVVYENDKQVSREVFNTSSYEVSNQIIEVGTSGASASAIDALEAAVSRQSMNAIDAALGWGYDDDEDE